MDASMLLPRQDEDNALSNFRYYYYSPSMPAAIIFIILFAISTTLHLTQMFVTRTWFLVPFVIGGIFETIGYIGRALSANENPGTYTLGPYIIQSVLLLVAPALFAASIYMELARISLMTDGEKALFIRRKWLTKIFVGGDIISFLMQASGAGLLSSGDSDTIDTGNTIVIAGLVVQVIFFGLFVIAGAIFHIRMRRLPTSKSYSTPWQKHMISLYLVSVMIFIRSIIRVIEYVQGYDGYVFSHEAFLYVFDGLVMWCAMLVMNWIHPSEVAGYLRGGKVFRNAWQMENLETESVSRV